MADQISSSIALRFAPRPIAAGPGLRLFIDIFDSAGEQGVFHTLERAGRVLLILAKDDSGFTTVD